MKHLTIILIALTLISGSLFAQSSLNDKKMAAGRTPDDNGKLVDRLKPIDNPMTIKEMLNLSDKQTKKMDELKTALQKQINTMNAQIQNLALDKEKAMKDEDFNNAKKLNGQIFDLKKAMANARIDHMQAMLKELSADQKAIIKEQCQLKGGMMMGQNWNQQGMCGGFHGRSMGHGMMKRTRNPEDEDCQAMPKNSPNANTKTEK